MKLKIYNSTNIIDELRARNLPESLIREISLCSEIIPFRVNNHVLDNLINWDEAENDPIFNLVFPQKKFLSAKHYEKALGTSQSFEAFVPQEIVRSIHEELNPNPSSQKSNIPYFRGNQLKGLQHKYSQTVLVFLEEAQQCHSFCTFCFRWPQFTNNKDWKFGGGFDEDVLDYISQDKKITDIVFTGGDPMIMSVKKIKNYLEQLLDPKFSHIKNIRIGTKALTYWPYKFYSEKPSLELLDLFKRVNESKRLTVMAHINHPNEMNNEGFHIAVSKILETGSRIKSQAPILRGINNSSEVWTKKILDEYRLGIEPYYMFIERPTGPSQYFSIPIAEAFEIYWDTMRNVSGLVKTLRGPVMSTSMGKVVVDGIVNFDNEKFFSLRFLQAKNSNLIGETFLSKYCTNAKWINELRPQNLFTKDWFIA